MNYEIKVKEQITKIEEYLTTKDIAIFCGAGISYNSGLPLAKDVVKTILEGLKINKIESDIILNSNLPFESFIQTLSDEVNIDNILDIFTKGNPNNNHEFIAEIIKKGLVKTVLTTNFDLLLEKSLEKKGLEKIKHYDVFSTDEEFGKIDWNSKKIRLIKIHGCISNKKEIGITLNEVAKRTTSLNKFKTVDTFFSNKINKNVLVIGYSCSDVFDISPQIEMIDTNKSEVFYIEHTNKNSISSIENISLKVIKNPFKKFKGNRININVDDFVKQLWLKFLKKPYKYKFDKINWIENIDNWINESIIYSIGIKNQIAGRLLYDIGEYEFSLKHWEDGLIIAQKEKNQTFFYALLGNLGNTLNALGKYKEAKQCLEESTRVCKEIGNIQGEIAQLQSLGNVYRNLTEYDSAIKVYLRAIELAEKEYIDGLCTSIGNLASIFTQKKQPDEALQCLEKGLDIALKIGNKQSEGSMLCGIGIAHFQKGNIEESIQYIQKSINLTRLLNDKQGECMALLNLSNVLLEVGKNEISIKTATESLVIAEKIGSKQSEAHAYYNIGSAYFFNHQPVLAIEYFKKSYEIYIEIYGTEHEHTKSVMNGILSAQDYMKKFK